MLLPLGLALLAGGAASTWFDGPQALSGPLLVFGGAAFGGALADPRADWRMWRNPAGEEPMERKVRRMRLLACYLSGALSGAAMWWGLAG